MNYTRTLKWSWWNKNKNSVTICVFLFPISRTSKTSTTKNICTCKYCVAWTLGFPCYSAIRGNNTAVIHKLSLCFDKDWLGHRTLILCLFQIVIYHLVVFRGYKKVSEWEGDWYQCPFKTPVMWPQNFSICWGKAIFREMQAPQFTKLLELFFFPCWDTRSFPYHNVSIPKCSLLLTSIWLCPGLVYIALLLLQGLFYSDFKLAGQQSGSVFILC